MEDLEYEDSDDSDFGQEGIVVITTIDQSLRISAWVNSVPNVLIGFYYMSDSEIKIKTFDLIAGNSCSLIDCIIGFDELKHLEFIKSIKVYPLLSSTNTGVNFRKFIYWLETGLDTKPDTIPEVKHNDWTLESFKDLDMDLESKNKVCPEFALRTVYKNRHTLFSSPFDLEMEITPSTDKHKRSSATRVRDLMLNLTEIVFESSLSGTLEPTFTKLITPDSNTTDTKDLLFKVNSWINHGIFYHNEFREEFSELFSDGKSEKLSAHVLSMCDRDMVPLSDIRLQLRNVIAGLITQDSTPQINLRNIIKIYNQLSVLINEDVLTVDGRGTSWSALVVDSPKNKVAMTSVLKDHNRLVFSLCHPKITGITNEEALEVLLYLEGLDEVEQSRYLNIKHELIEYMK